MADSIYYIKLLAEYLGGSDMFAAHTGRLNAAAGVMGDPNALTEILGLGREEAAQRASGFMSALYGVFPKERVSELCRMIIDYQTGLDGKETLFYAESALLEVRRYFFRHQKQWAEIMGLCGFPFEQRNEALLPLASSINCSYEPPYMKPAPLFPETYGKLPLPSELPIDPAFIEPDRKAGILEYIDPEIREGLLARGNQGFYSKYSDFFSTYFADSALFLDKFTTAPSGMESKERGELLEYLGKLIKAANVEPDSWADPRLLNKWLDKAAYDELKREMKQYGVIEGVVEGGRADMPGWENRFHAEKVQFRYWKPLMRGFVRMGANSILEYQSLEMLESAVADENGRAASPGLDAYFELLKEICAAENYESFESIMGNPGNLTLMAGMAADIKKKKIPESSYLYVYYDKVSAPFFVAGQYKILMPPVSGGDTLNAFDGELLAKAEPALGPGEPPVPCRIEKTVVPAQKNSVAKVTAASPGLMRGGDVIIQPFAAIETPVSPQDKLEELAESLDGIIHELRTEKDVLGVRRYINSFIHCLRIVGHAGKLGPLPDTKRKIEWLNQNHFVYNLFNFTPEEGFGNLVSVLGRYGGALEGRIRLGEYKEAFFTSWGLCLSRLNAMGIKETPITPYKTRVGKRELLDGWNKENTEGREPDEGHPGNMVYAVLKKGIEVDGQLVQKPVVNVYS